MVPDFYHLNSTGLYLRKPCNTICLANGKYFCKITVEKLQKTTISLPFHCTRRNTANRMMMSINFQHNFGLIDHKYHFQLSILQVLVGLPRSGKATADRKLKIPGRINCKYLCTCVYLYQCIPRHSEIYSIAYNPWTLKTYCLAEHLQLLSQILDASTANTNSRTLLEPDNLQPLKNGFNQRCPELILETCSTL